jgi:hypothetical protein
VNVVTNVCQAIGMCDIPLLPPAAVDVICDASVGSSCVRTTLESVLDAELRRIIERPGSTVRLWELGSTVGETRLIGEQRVPVATKPNARARRAHEDGIAVTAKAYFLKSAESALRGPGKRRSPILEGLTKVALARDPGAAHRRIVVVTDGREYSDLADFECGNLPQPAIFVRELQRRSVFTPGALADTSVLFVGMTMDNIHGGRCAASVAREVAVRDLWRAALVGAGAVDVEFRMGNEIVRSHAGREGR